MNLPTFRHTPVSLWLGEAMTEFINGCIDGYGGGAVSGAGTGILTGTTEVGADMTAWHQVVISFAAVLAAMLGNGIQTVYIWHKTHRFPNPWPAPTGTTVPPFVPPTAPTP